MILGKKPTPSIIIAITGVMTALVTIATLSFQIYIPATFGYFNIGESLVYITALLFGPYIGAFAGGVGSMMADLLTGYYIYAPWTLVNKGIEGYIVGFITSKALFKSKTGWLGILLAAITSLSLGFIGITFFIGPAEIFGVLTSEITLWYGTIEIPLIVWPIIAVIAFALIAIQTRHSDVKTVTNVSAMLIGGAWMVFGYFIWQQFVLGFAAIAEVPFNIAQVLVGITIALPTARAVERAIKS